MLKIIEIATLPKNAYFPNYLRYLSQILTAQIEELNEDCVKISREIGHKNFRKIGHQKASRSGRADSSF